MITEFLYRQPVEIHFGRGRSRALKEILSSHGLRHGLLVCGRHFSEDARRLAEEIGACGVYADIRENPLLSGVEETVRIAKAQQADCIIGIGGGSAMDTAKFAAAIAREDANAEEYFSGRRAFPARGLPIVAIPTTAGTGSEVTQVSVISHGSVKRTINHPAFMPAIAVVDPDLSDSVPPFVVMCTGLDALAHALEGYWSRQHQPLSDLMAVEAVRLITQNLEQAWADPFSREAHENMAFAALLGGLAFAMPKTAGCHACSYPLCEHFPLSHGEACAFTLDSFVRVNADPRLEQLCQAAAVGNTRQLAAWIARMKELAGLRTRLSQLDSAAKERAYGAGGADTAGPAEEITPQLLARESAVHPLMRNNPVSLDVAELTQLFEALR